VRQVVNCVCIIGRKLKGSSELGHRPIPLAILEMNSPEAVDYIHVTRIEVDGPLVKRFVVPIEPLLVNRKNRKCKWDCSGGRS